MPIPNARLRPRWNTRADSPSPCEDGQVMMVLDAGRANQRAMRANRCTRRAQEVWPPKTFQRGDLSIVRLAKRLNVRARLPLWSTPKKRCAVLNRMPLGRAGGSGAPPKLLEVPGGPSGHMLVPEGGGSGSRGTPPGEMGGFAPGRPWLGLRRKRARVCVCERERECVCVHV